MEKSGSELALESTLRKNYENFRLLKSVQWGRLIAQNDPLVRDPNFREKLNAKAKRKRIFFRKKMRSESEANSLLFNAKKCEANPYRKIAKKMRKSHK